MSYYLIGHPLGHSFSPRLHALLGNPDYRLMDLDASELKDFLLKKEFDGINVTIPYKQSVIPFCDEVSEIALGIGSVNTIVRRGDGTLYGDNTDARGLMAMADQAGITLENKVVVILGSGGTGHTAWYVAQAAGAAKIYRVSRSGPVNYDTVYRTAENAQVIINATPVGMYPRPYEPPLLDLNRFPRLEAVLDVIYNPLRTRLTLEAEKWGLKYANGLRMLVEQACAAEELFMGCPVPVQAAERAFRALAREQVNLILIGMPGSGKTTIGRLLAQKTGLRFVDSDEEAASVAGKPIPELIREAGEAPFRALEAAVLSELSRRSGLVIATGGGAVLDADNVRRLRQNGRLIFLDRPLSDLAPDDAHPLSDTQAKLTALYAARHPIYAACADRTVSGFPDPQAAAEAVYALWKEDK
jgi:shikimate dehydrogenase